MPQTDFTKAFPPGNPWGRRYLISYDPAPQTATVVGEADGWETVYFSTEKFNYSHGDMVMTCDNQIDLATAELDFSSALTKDPTDWEPER